MIRISVGMGGFLMWVGGCGSDGLGFSDGMMIGIGSLKASAAVGRGIYARRFKIYLCLSGLNARPTITSLVFRLPLGIASDYASLHNILMDNRILFLMSSIMASGAI